MADKLLERRVELLQVGREHGPEFLDSLPSRAAIRALKSLAREEKARESLVDTFLDRLELLESAQGRIGALTQLVNIINPHTRYLREWVNDAVDFLALFDQNVDAYNYAGILNPATATAFPTTFFEDGAIAYFLAADALTLIDIYSHTQATGLARSTYYEQKKRIEEARREFHIDVLTQDPDRYTAQYVPILKAQTPTDTWLTYLLILRDLQTSDSKKHLCFDTASGDLKRADTYFLEAELCDSLTISVPIRVNSRGERMPIHPAQIFHARPYENMSKKDERKENEDQIKIFDRK